MTALGTGQTKDSVLARLESDLAAAEETLSQAQATHKQALRARDLHIINSAKGPALAALTRTNDEAQHALREIARGMHPGIADYSRYSSKPSVGALNLMGVRIDYPIGVDEDFLAGLEVALVEFADEFQPTVPDDSVVTGYRCAEAFGGDLYYEPHVGGKAYFTTRWEPKYVEYATTTQALADLRDRYAYVP